MQALGRIAAGVGGFLLVGLTLSSLVQTLVIPRGLSSRMTAWVARTIHRLFHLLTRPARSYERTDALLAGEGPSVLLALLALWVLLLLGGYGLILFALVDGATVPGALREAGSSMLTLGFVQPTTASTTIVDFLAAATGLIVVALQIAYLPTLYSAFNRREVLVATLEARAGSPAWGPEILARHQLTGLVENLANFYEAWEEWAADVAESHANYPVLTTLRSPKPLRSWVIALLSVMDSAALYLSLSPQAAPTEARLCLRMSFTCLRDIAAVLRIPFDADPRPDAPMELTFDDFEQAVARLESVPNGPFPMERTAEQAWPHFCGWRVNYESLAYALADRTDAVPAPWSGRRSHLRQPQIDVQPPPNRSPDNPDGTVTPR